MRTIHEFRDYQFETLSHALERPSMYCGTAFGADIRFFTILQELCWIDERAADWKRIAIDFLWGSRRVLGQLEDQRYKIGNCINEVTSTYAQIAHILGYYKPNRLLNPSSWQLLLASLGIEFFGRNWNETDVYELFGEPSLTVIGGTTSVSCYAPDGPVEKWIFFDFSYPEAVARTNAQLRNVRINRNQLQLLPAFRLNA